MGGVWGGGFGVSTETLCFRAFPRVFLTLIFRLILAILRPPATFPYNLQALFHSKICLLYRIETIKCDIRVKCGVLCLREGGSGGDGGEAAPPSLIPYLSQFQSFPLIN